MEGYFFISNKGNMLSALKEKANMIFLLGILLIIVGTLAIVFSFTSTILSVMFLGALLLTEGIIEAVQTFTIKKWSTFLLHLLISILFIVSGIFIIAYPGINAISLTLFFAILFVAVGIYKIFFALTKNVPHSGWLLLNGALNLLIGVLIWQQWPASGLWVLGTFVGIDMLLTGWTWVMLALAAKKA